MTSCLFILIAICGLPATTTATRPATTQEMKSEERASREARVRQLPVIGPMRLNQVLQIELKQNRVTPTLLVPAKSEQQRILITAEDSFTTTMRQTPAPPNPPADLFQFVRWDFTDPSLVVIYTWASAHPGYAQLVATWDHGNEITRQVTLLDQDTTTGEDGEEIPPYLDLHVEEISFEGEKSISLSLRSIDLPTMQREHPCEVNAYLRPMLRQLNAEHLLTIDPKLAWQVFGQERHPDEKVTTKLLAILPKLDSSEFSQRQSAAEEIKKLGFDGVIALMHVDRSHLSAEQISRIEEILAEYQSQDAEKSKALATRPDFLLDCLTSEDPQIRQLAAKHLEKATTQPIVFDPAAATTKRNSQLDQLRHQLLLPPATQAIPRED